MQSNSTGVILVEKGHHKIFPFEKRTMIEENANDSELQDIRRIDCQNIAQVMGLNVHRMSGSMTNGPGQKGREDQADDGIFF